MRKVRFLTQNIFNIFRHFLSLLMYRRGLGAFSVIHRGNHGNECITTATAVVQNGHDEGKSGCGLRESGEDGEEVEKVEEQKYSLRDTEKRMRRQFNQSSVEGIFILTHIHILIIHACTVEHL